MRPLLVGFTVRALAESAVRAGVEPVAVDYFGDRDLKAVCPAAIGIGQPYDPWTLVRRAQELTWDAVMYTGGLENQPAVVAELSRRAPLLGNPPGVLRAVRDWGQVSMSLQAAGFRVPRSLPPGSRVPADGTWLIKPVAGSGGAGVAVAASGDVAGPGKLIQEYLPGVPGSVLFGADGRHATLLGVTELLRPNHGNFHYAGNILLPSPPSSRLAALCQVLTERFGLVGVNGVDFVLDDDGDPLPLEVNPRYTAAMELLEDATGCSVFGMHRNGPAPLPPWQDYYGKAIVYGDRPGTWQFAGDWAAEGIRDVPFPGDPVLPGRPICTVIARGQSRDDCLARLVARTRAVREAYVDAH